MAPHHRLGITLLENAVPRADDVRLRRLVFKMSAYHASEFHDLERRADEWNVTTSAQFPGWISNDDIDALGRLTGTAYDVRWLELMIRHHEGALTLAAAEIAGGSDGDLEDLAQRISTSQRDEIERMRLLVEELCAGNCGAIATPAGWG